MKRSTIPLIATLGLSLTLLSACGEKQPEPTPLPPPPPVVQPTATPVPATPTPAPSPAETPGAPAGTPAATKPSQPAGSKTATSLREHGDKARNLIKEIKKLSDDVRKLASEIEGNTDNIYVKAQVGAINATDRQIEQFRDKSSQLNDRTKELKALIEEMDKEVGKLK